MAGYFNTISSHHIHLKEVVYDLSIYRYIIDIDMDIRSHHDSIEKLLTIIRIIRIRIPCIFDVENHTGSISGYGPTIPDTTRPYPEDGSVTS
jgi:hypothetical protein